MLEILCGEDTGASRARYQSLRTELKEQGYELVDIPKTQFGAFPAPFQEHTSLFFQKQAFFTDHFIAFLKKNRTKAMKQIAEDLSVNPDIRWIDWEEYPKRMITPPKNAKIMEFAVPISIFQFLESLKPGSAQKTVSILQTLLQSAEEGFVYAMLQRHIRALLIARSGGASTPMSPWQRKKLHQQALFWKENELIRFYDNLARLDESVKTSTNAFGIGKSLELVLIHSL